VRISKVEAGEPARTSPQFAAMPPYPGMQPRRSFWAFVGGKLRGKGK
jgi:hypothetical protein